MKFSQHTLDNTGQKSTASPAAAQRACGAEISHTAAVALR